MNSYRDQIGLTVYSMLKSSSTERKYFILTKHFKVKFSRYLIILIQNNKNHWGVSKENRDHNRMLKILFLKRRKT